jgi:hypothetical protein
VIVVQAEESNGIQVVGVRHFNGETSLTTGDEVELLGTERPR